MAHREVRVRHGFLYAWILLVAVVVFGFCTQAVAIRHFEKEQDVTTVVSIETARRQERNAETLCGLLAVISDTEDQDLIARTFRSLGYDCKPPTG